MSSIFVSLISVSSRISSAWLACLSWKIDVEFVEENLNTALMYRRKNTFLFQREILVDKLNTEC